MAQILVDTSKIYQSINNIKMLTKDTTNELNMLFKRIEEVPSISKEWVGASSLKFCEMSKSEKIMYYKFLEDLNLYNKFLENFASSLDTCINNIKGRI